MAALSNQERADINTLFQQQASDTHSSLAVTKPQLRAAVDAIDQWIDDNATSFNSAIPQPARSALTAKQKAWLFKLVMNRRFEVTP